MSFYHSVKDTPPPFFKDFYDRLFWYGFDSTETTGAADKTMFGGTRGKFQHDKITYMSDLSVSIF